MLVEEFEHSHVSRRGMHASVKVTVKPCEILLGLMMILHGVVVQQSNGCFSVSTFSTSVLLVMLGLSICVLRVVLRSRWRLRQLLVAWPAPSRHVEMLPSLGLLCRGFAVQC